MERINIMETNVFTEAVGGSGTDFSPSSSSSCSPSDKVYCVDKSVPVNFSYTQRQRRAGAALVPWPVFCSIAAVVAQGRVKVLKVTRPPQPLRYTPRKHNYLMVNNSVERQTTLICFYLGVRSSYPFNFN